MIFSLVIAIIATGAFYKQSKAIGARPGNMASIPFVALGIILVIERIAGMILLSMAGALGISIRYIDGSIWLLHIFILLMYLAVIRAYWLALNLPSKPSE